MKTGIPELIDTFKEMTLVELAEFKRLFEETFGVTANPVISLSGEGVTTTAEPVEPEQSEFDVVIKEIGPNKVQVIKVVREVTHGLGLREAKELVEAAPKAVLERVDRTRADEVSAKLEATGATIEVR